MKLRQTTVLCALLLLCILSASVLALERSGGRGRGGRGGRGGIGGAEDDDGWEVISEEEYEADLAETEAAVDGDLDGRGGGGGGGRRRGGSRRRGGGGDRNRGDWGGDIEEEPLLPEGGADSTEGGGGGGRRRGGSGRRRGDGSDWSGDDFEWEMEEPPIDGVDPMEGGAGESQLRGGYTVKKLYGDKNDKPNAGYPRRVAATSADLDTRTMYSYGAVPNSPQQQRVRLRGDRGDLNPNEGRVEIKYGNMWGLVCDDHFGLNEASVVCRSLGFSRGANKYYSGSFFGTGKFGPSDILMERVRCSPHGGESGLHRCSHSHNFQCSVNNTAGVECTYNEGCEQGWIGYDGLCYRVEPSAKTAEEAASECTETGGSLVYVLSEGENSFISNLLHTKFQNINAVWTGGQFAQVETELGRSRQAWVFRDSAHVIQREKSHWFPGFSDGSSARPTIDKKKKSCLALSNIFYSSSTDKDTLVNYFWWDNVSCKTRLPFICQKLAATSSCYNGTGEDYMGDVSRTEDGSLCQSWGDDNPDWLMNTFDLRADERNMKDGSRGRPNGDAEIEEVQLSDQSSEDVSRGSDRSRGGSRSSSSSRGRSRGGSSGGRSSSRGRRRGRGRGRNRGSRTQAYLDAMGHGRRRLQSWRRRDHNYCRNPDSDRKPWCWLDKGKGIFGYCNIDKCANASAPVVNVTVAPTTAPGGSFNSPMCSRPSQFYCPSMMYYRPKCFSEPDVCDGYRDCIGGEDEDASFCRAYKCQDEEFYCSKIHRCIPQSRVCDKHYDCDYGDDETEEACRKYRPANSTIDGQLSGYSKIDSVDLYLNIPVDVTTISYFTLSLLQCKAKCERPDNWYFYCTGFLYSPNGTFGSECSLLSRRLPEPIPVESAPATYYEKLQTCQISTHIVCKSGQCIPGSLECNGYDDCGDFTDEIGPERCPDPRPTFEVRLSGGKGPYEGRIEARLLKEWGLVCDDGLDASMGDLICNQLGYPQGAEKLSHNARREFGRGSGIFLMGSVNCTGNITSLYDCQHSGWKNTNCSVNNVAGLVCRRDRACTMKEFRCSDRCVPLASVCDGVPDCSDGTDESACGNMTLTLRGGNSSASGILEVTRGNISGVVCDDTFGPGEAAVACRHLNISGRSRLLPPGSYQTPQSLVMWVQDVQCNGSETSLFNCSISGWGNALCDVSEAVAVECGLPEIESTTSTESSSAVPTTATTSSTTTTTTTTATKTPASAVTGTASPNDTQPLNSTSGVCGLRFGRFPASRIVNGYRASGGQFPWQVGIRLKTSSLNDIQWCGGTIISDRWIVSASHCFEEYPKSSYVLRIGDLDNTVREPSESEFDIDLLFKHPKYSGNPAIDYDLALIRIRPDRLGNYISFEDAVQPACLPEATLVPPKGTVCHVSGWGSVGDFDLPSNLMAANVPLIDNARCNQLYVDRITDRMLCAGFEAGGIDSCQGDSGGPLVCKIDGRYILMGATSWGDGCAMPNAPGVYANVRNMRSWIDQTIRSNP